MSGSPEQQDAQETLAFIRQTIESASTFTAVAGWGLVGAGMVGLVAAWLAWAAGDPVALHIWIPTALAGGITIVGTTLLKARRLGVPFLGGSAQKMVWGLAPALTAGAALTHGLASSSPELLPGTWLAIYGAAVTGTATFSVREVRWMGLAFLTLGLMALYAPAAPLTWLAAGFGMLHIVFGMVIAFRYDG